MQPAGFVDYLLRFAQMRDIGKGMKRPTDLKIGFETFTSSEIEHILDTSSNWRLLNKHQVAKYLGAMRRGEWNCANGETVTFESAMSLVDGQHRMKAAAIYQRESGDPVWFLCVHNVQPDSVLTMDTGKSRTLAQILTRQGQVRASACASISRSIVCSQGKIGNMRWLDGMSSLSVTAEYDAWQQNKKSIQEWTCWLSRFSQAGLSRCSLLMTMLYHLSQVNPTEAGAFAGHMCTGVNLDEGDGAHLLRQVLIRDRSSKTKMTTLYSIAMMIKGYNAWVTGSPVRILRYQMSGINTEVWPSPVIL